MGWLIALAVCLLIGCIPLGAEAAYDAQGPRAWLVIGPLRKKLYPGKEKKKEEKPKPEKKAKTDPKPKKKTDDKPKEKKGGKLSDFLPIVKTVLDFLGDFRRKLRINRLELKWIMAGGDPCDLAVNYGKAWTAVGGLMPLLERVFVIKKRNVEVECDFLASETTVLVRLELTITVGRLLYLVFRYGIRAMLQYFQINNQRKGGAKP